jgi:hypothetical protein
VKLRGIRDRALDLHDAALDALRRIDALAALLQAATGGGDHDPPLDAHEIEEATGIIHEESNKVRHALNLMRRLVGQPAKTKGRG